MKTLKHAAALTLVGLTLASCGSGQTSGAPAIPKDKAIENKVESVLKTLTLEEKAGQMVQLTSETF